MNAFYDAIEATARELYLRALEDVRGLDAEWCDAGACGGEAMNAFCCAVEGTARELYLRALEDVRWLDAEWCDASACGGLKR